MTKHKRQWGGECKKRSEAPSCQFCPSRLPLHANAWVRGKEKDIWISFFFFFSKFSLLYHLSFLVDVFNNDFCKMCIIITNVLEPGLNLLECVGGQTGSIQMASDGALILRKKCVFVGLPLMRSFNCCDRRYCRKTEK